MKIKFDVTPSFEIHHIGRGGDLTILLGDRTLLCPIEMFEGGAFLVSFPRLDKHTKDGLRPLLRTWLDDTDRAEWFIEN